MGKRVLFFLLVALFSVTIKINLCSCINIWVSLSFSYFALLPGFQCVPFILPRIDVVIVIFSESQCLLCTICDVRYAYTRNHRHCHCHCHLHCVAVVVAFCANPALELCVYVCHFELCGFTSILTSFPVAKAGNCNHFKNVEIYLVCSRSFHIWACICKHFGEFSLRNAAHKLQNTTLFILSPCTGWCFQPKIIRFPSEDFCHNLSYIAVACVYFDKCSSDANQLEKVDI